MASNQYVFKAFDNIGALEAEQDGEFLTKCFIDTGIVDILTNTLDRRCIIIGRTGVGKSALLLHIEANKEHTIRIEPDFVALSYLSNSTIISKFVELNIDLDLFFRLLWKHIFVIELIKKYHKMNHARDKSSIISFLKDKLSLQTGKQDIIAYLSGWDNKFWLENDVHVRQIVEKFEAGIKANAGSEGIFELGSNASLSSELRKEIEHRCKKFISETQIQSLAKAFQGLSTIFDDPQKPIYIIIDGLDQKWIDSSLKSRLILALIETCRDFIKLQNIKAIIALRADLLQKVLWDTRDGGYQEEKYKDTCIDVHWSNSNLKRMIDERINALVRKQYTNEKLCFEDIFCNKIHDRSGDHDTLNYILERTLMRPRDAISLVNECIKQSDGKTEISATTIKDVERNYSAERLKSLYDEWLSNYPKIRHVVKIIKPEKHPFVVSDISEDVWLTLWSELVDDGNCDDALCKVAVGVNQNTPIGFMPLKKMAFYILFKVAIVGLKLKRHETYIFSDISDDNISSDDITEDTGIKIHKMFWRYYGLAAR